MDAKETLINTPSLSKKIPILGIIFVLIASAAFYLCRTQNLYAWTSIYDYYSEHLLQQEKLLYQDFYYKRLAIEQRGTQSQLDSIKQAIANQEHKALSKIILTDRSFRIFLTQKAPIYFSATQKQQWIEHNKALSLKLHTLSEYRFAIIPELFITRPAITNLFTHIFVDTNSLNFLSNIVLFLLLAIFIERLIKRRLFCTLLLVSSLAFSCLYLFIGSSFSAPLTALNGTIYLMAALCLSYFLKHHYRIKCQRSNLYLFLALSLLTSKIILDIYSNIFSDDFLISLIIICLCGVLASWFYLQFNDSDTALLNTEGNNTEHLPSHARQKYSEAFLGLSRFNFEYARTLLRRLRESYPNSLNILESSYYLEKLQPDEANFWSLAQIRIEHCLVTQDYKGMLAIFHDIQKAAPKRQSASKHISPEHYLKMLVIFIQHGDIVKAEHAFMFLELAGDPYLVKDACKLLIDIFSKKHNLKKQSHYQDLLDRYLEAN